MGDGKTMEQQSFTCINLRKMGKFSENVSSIYDNTCGVLRVAKKNIVTPK